MATRSRSTSRSEMMTIEYPERTASSACAQSDASQAIAIYDRLVPIYARASAEQSPGQRVRKKPPSTSTRPRDSNTARNIGAARDAFRRLHESGCFVLANPWDIGGVRRPWPRQGAPV